MGTDQQGLVTGAARAASPAPAVAAAAMGVAVAEAAAAAATTTQRDEWTLKSGRRCEEPQWHSGSE